MNPNVQLVNIRFSKEFLARLDAAKDKLNEDTSRHTTLSRADVIRMILEDGVQAIERRGKL